MQRLDRNHTVPVEQRYRVYEPALTVRQGEAFVVETVNFRTPVIRTPEDANPAHYREREETGPIYIEGIASGDIMAIHIDAIKPEGHASGGWWESPDLNSFLPLEDGRVLFPGGLWAPQHMMIGDIYATPDRPGPNPGDNGGNMDFRDVTAGNTLLLRAQREGGLLVLGDVHAAQGDGEILGLGAECAAEVQLRVEKETRLRPVRPLIRKPHSFVCVAARSDYAEARDLAVGDASDILAELADVTRQEAYLYVTTIGHLRNGGVWMMKRGQAGSSPPVTVGVEVPLHGLGW